MSAGRVITVGAERHDPTHRIVLTHATRMLASVLARHRVRDANTPFRLEHRPLFAHLAPRIPPHTFAPAIPVVIGAYRARARVADVEVTHHARPHGRSTSSVGRLTSAVVRSAIQTVAISTGRMPTYQSTDEGRSS